MDLINADSGDPPSLDTTHQVKTRDLLVSLGFKTVKVDITDEQPGYLYDFGNMKLLAAQVMSKYLFPVIRFSGVWSTSRSISEIAFESYLTVASYEEGVALIAYGIRKDFTPLRKTAWLDAGRTWEDHLPWKREMRRYEQRPQCHIEADWFRVAAKKLTALGQSSGDDETFSVYFVDQVITIESKGQKIAMPAAGPSWTESYRCRSQGLRHISKRTPSSGVTVSVWENYIHIGNLRLPLDESAVASPIRKPCLKSD